MQLILCKSVFDIIKKYNKSKSVYKPKINGSGDYCAIAIVPDEDI